MAVRSRRLSEDAGDSNGEIRYFWTPKTILRLKSSYRISTSGMIYLKKRKNTVCVHFLHKWSLKRLSIFIFIFFSCSHYTFFLCIAQNLTLHSRLNMHNVWTFFFIVCLCCLLTFNVFTSSFPLLYSAIYFSLFCINFSVHLFLGFPVILHASISTHLQL